MFSDLTRIKNRVFRTLSRPRVEVWHHPAYRIPIPGMESISGFETRRADLAKWYLLDVWACGEAQFRTPRRVRYREMNRVHGQAFLESLSVPQTLARVFAVDEAEVPADEVMRTMRLACGATLQAAVDCVQTNSVALNLLGGFHHAGPNQAGGLCVLSDIAIAIAELRAMGMNDLIAVLDLDAHPPDGLAACLEDDARVWIGSISGEHWEELPRVDETLLRPGSGDDTYLPALRSLLRRMPDAALTFVIAGGDVLASDRMGKLSLTVAGARMRDRLVWKRLRGRPSVWLPGGGYMPQSWRVLAGTALVLCCRSTDEIPTDYDPVRAHFGWIAGKLSSRLLEGSDEIRAEDLDEVLGIRRPAAYRLLDFYSREGLEYAFAHYGILPHMRRLGYSHLEVSIAPVDLGGIVQIYGTALGVRHLLLELVVERRSVKDRPVLYVHWLALRNPRATFHAWRPQLPGQDAPGLGLAREIGWVLARMAKRLSLDGVSYRPAWFHTAYAGRYHFVFVDPVQQGRFEAMARDFHNVPLIEITHAANEGRIYLNGQPYRWEAEEMVFWLKPSEEVDEEAVVAERDRAHFVLIPGTTQAENT